ncbi:MAG: arginine--tRNA ligase [bacterium]|nr:arginine--tRNA ligase [bacterium]
MDSVKKDVTERFADAVRTACGVEVSLDTIKLETPPTSDLGDFAIATFFLAKECAKSPQMIAGGITAALVSDDSIASASAVGPYVNITLTDAARGQLITAVQEYLSNPASQEKGTTLIEYFHANTHKAVHIGHVRNITMGEAIARLLEWSGKNVVRVNYQGDIGPHVAKCIWGFMRLCGGGDGDPRGMSDAGISDELAHLMSDVRCRRAGEGQGAWLSRVYSAAHHASEQSEEIAAEIKDLNKKLYDGDPDLMKVWKLTRQWCLDDFDRMYKEFGLKFDRLYFESEVEKRGLELVHELVKTGVAKESQGALIMDFSDTDLGVLVLVTGAGTALYGAKEVALAELKTKEYKNITKSFHLVGEEQTLYFRQIIETLKRMNAPLAEKSEHIVYGLVRLPEGKMSSREGTVILYEDLLNELMQLSREETGSRHADWNEEQVDATARAISLAAIKFEMLKADGKKTIIFDTKRAIDLHGDTGPYLLYTFARMNSILRKAKTESKKCEWSLLNSPDERAVLSLLMRTGDFVSQAASEYRPSLVLHHLLDLAKTFNTFYHEHRVLEAETPALRDARLMLVKTVGEQLRLGLGFLGIATLDEM